MNWPINSAFRIASASFLSTALLFAATGCEDPNDLGVELPGTSPTTTEYRDYRVNASTILQDSVETLNADRVLIGKLTDATLGTTTAKAYFNLRASTDTLPSQLTSSVLDSVVLVSSFDQVYGSASRPVSFDLFKLKEDLDDKKTYNAGVTDVAVIDQIGDKLTSSLNRTTTTQVAVDPGVLKSKKKLNPDKTPADSTVSVTNPDQTIRLVIQKDKVRNSDFANTLFAALKDASFNQNKLDALWKGLAIVPSSNQTGAIVALSRSSLNCVYVYYHGLDQNDATKTRRPSYRIRMGLSYASGDANTPRYYTQLSTDLKPPFDQLLDGTKSLRVADSVTYMQQGLGLATKLAIPGLKELAGQPGLAINRAELLIPIKSSGTLLFPNPTSAFLYEINAQNRVLQRTVNISPVERIVQANLQNQSGQGREAVVSLYDVDASKKYYSVVITTYLQAYLSNQLGEQAAALMLSPVLRRSFDLSLNRSVLDAQNIKLRVYSSKLR
ncbi:DUF4270 family protein [Hymenobacter cellulosilyticus]|uniref:DUF4270 domain-containing protein n=1 Tax=Hymenobacter cellulosilyticus TaxID=2932248 RepID=A0A8T9Q7A0_9BACT|nr:DUF4270 family protein [Hymenobacter cellulosilyticus]UOQ73404.1 DUF4270 domain-containing protein [Hymenobacter cellulosilyticus]